MLKPASKLCIWGSCEKPCVSGTEKGRERKGIVCPHGSLWLPSFTRNKEFAHRLKMLTLFSLLSCFLNFQVLEVGYQSLNRNNQTAVNQTGQCMFCRTWNQHNFTKLWYVMSLKMFGCFVHSRCGNKLLTPCEVIGILKSGKFLLVEYDILGFQICNLL